MNPHELLLRMAGRIPDSELCQARRMLADGAVTAAVALLAGRVAHDRIPLAAAELAAIRELSGDADVLSDVQPATELPALPYAFSELDRDGEVSHDQLDEAVVAVAETDGAAVSAMWRTWRYPLLSRLLPDATANGPGAERAAEEPEGTVSGVAADLAAEPFIPHRVYLVEAADEATIGPLAASLLAVVPDSANAGIEVVGPGGELPPYQQAALEGSMLVWAATDEPEFKVARVYDYADAATGPHFLPEHRVVDDMVERERLLAYLRGGHPVLTTMSTMFDILDPSAGSVVPGSFLTDGEWIWTDTVTYYLDRHGMAPDAELTAHIERQVAGGTVVPQTDRETAIRAGDFMLDPPENAKRTAVWRPGDHSA